MTEDYPASSTEPACSRPVDAMTTDYRALFEKLVGTWDARHDLRFIDWIDSITDIVDRARALLAEPVAEGPKPVVDYSRVPEIATEAQIRSAAQYLIKKRNCDGDLIDAIEYAIARKNLPTPRPVAVSERLPEPSVKVLAHYFNALGNGRTICAIWVPAKSRSDEGDLDADDFLEYDEDGDKYYWPEGWYEAIENWEELGWVKVYEGEIAYWQPLPQWPANALPTPEAKP